MCFINCDYSTHDSFPIYNLFSLSNALRTSLKIFTILLHYLVFSWVKVNIDGFSKRNLSPASCGVIYRGPREIFLCYFTISIENQTLFYVKLYAIIYSIEFVYHKGWHSLWLECDSMIIYSYLKSDITSPPWQLCTTWLNCPATIKSLRFYYRHIYGKLMVLQTL